MVLLEFTDEIVKFFHESLCSNMDNTVRSIVCNRITVGRVETIGDNRNRFNLLNSKIYISGKILTLDIIEHLDIS